MRQVSNGREAFCVEKLLDKLYKIISNRVRRCIIKCGIKRL
jgi:hypothetical protein